MPESTPDKRDERVLILAPEGEADVLDAMLRETALERAAFPSLPDLCGALRQGAGALLLSESALGESLSCLAEALIEQPGWSDLPILLLCGGEAPGTAAARDLEKLGNVVVLSAPLRRATLQSALRMSLRSRARQYQIRDYLRRQKQTETALRASEERFRSIFDQAAVGIGLRHPGGRFFQVNRALCEMLGYPPEAFTRLDFRDITPPEDLPAEEEMARKLTSSEIGSYRMERRFVHRDGHLITVDLSCSLIPDSNGGPGFVISVVEDITGRKAAEMALRESEERLRLAAEAADIGIWEWDLQADIQTWDDRCKALFGLLPEAPVSYDVWLSRLHPEDREQMKKTSLTPGEDLNSEYRVIWPDGTLRWLYARGAIRTDDKGRPEQMSGIVMDVTERKTAETMLREAKETAESANRAKSEFLANMSHEIRTPLTVVMGALELLHDSDIDAAQANFVEMAHSASETLLRLIEDLLDFSRIEAGILSIREEPFDLQACAASAVNSFFLDVERKKLGLHLEIDPDVPGIVVGDKDRLRQVLINLIGNAVKFTEQGEITVHIGMGTGPSDGSRRAVAFSVRDTGIGIPPEKADRLFKSFSQIDSSMTRRFGGTGLGLALSKRIVERMGGKIWMESTPGEGSTFSFTLPLAWQFRAQGGDALEIREGSAMTTDAKRGIRILLAEDEPLVREMVELILARRGWSVITAHTGLQAMQAWESGDFDLVLMDVQMPEMDGLEAARKIRAREQGSRVPIVALTAHARDEDRELCLAAGMDDYLRKPVQMDELYAIVEKHVPGAA